MLSLLRQRNFGLLWFGGLISFIGNWISGIALPVYIYNLTGSVLATGVTWISIMLPGVVLSSVAGVYVDRWDRRRTMLVANLLMVPLVLTLVVVQRPDQVWIVYVVSFTRSTISNFMGPAEQALLPRLVDEDQLSTANVLNTLNNNLARLIGPAIGGVVLGYFGFTYAVLLDTASFAIAAIMVALIRAPKEVTKPSLAGANAAAPSVDNVLKRVAHEWLEGLRLVRRSQLILYLFLFMGVANLSEGLFEVLIVPYVKDTLQGGATELGWFMTAQAIGGITGGFCLGRLRKRINTPNLVGPGLFLLGLCDMAVFNVPLFAVDAACFLLAGPPVIAMHAGTQTLLQTSVEDRYRGRVFGAFGATVALGIVVGQLIASFAGAATGPTMLMTAGASIMALCGLVATLVLPRHIAAGQPAPQPALE